jgi:hypothetical protein
LALSDRELYESKEQSLHRRLLSLSAVYRVLSSHRSSRRHECELTEFCQQTQVPMFEAYDALHPEGSSPGDLYRDIWHPGPAGHEAVARGLVEFLHSGGLLALEEGELDSSHSRSEIGPTRVDESLQAH